LTLEDLFVFLKQTTRYPLIDLFSDVLSQCKHTLIFIFKRWSLGDCLEEEELE